MSYIMATVTKIALRWQQCFIFAHAFALYKIFIFFSGAGPGHTAESDYRTNRLGASSKSAPDFVFR